jgi:hypothetical protein
MVFSFCCDFFLESSGSFCSLCFPSSACNYN